MNVEMFVATVVGGGIGSEVDSDTVLASEPVSPAGLLSFDLTVASSAVVAEAERRLAVMTESLPVKFVSVVTAFGLTEKAIGEDVEGTVEQAVVGLPGQMIGASELDEAAGAKQENFAFERRVLTLVAVVAGKKASVVVTELASATEKFEGQLNGFAPMAGSNSEIKFTI
nr:hypothetical protein Itr_chr13CG04630 [Ipomoea trifida]